MHGNQGHDKMKVKSWDNHTCTRMASNHDWCFRGDNTKYKEKK